MLFTPRSKCHSHRLIEIIFCLFLHQTSADMLRGKCPNIIKILILSPRQSVRHTSKLPRGSTVCLSGPLRHDQTHFGCLTMNFAITLYCHLYLIVY